MKTALATLFAAAVLAAAGAALVVWGGVYDVSATTGHTSVVYRLLETTMHRSVAVRAASIEPPSDAGARIERGAACYRDHCVQCHGAPGVAQGDIGKSLQPLPGPLIDAARRWQAREIYWITRHGIKMSGMPAWELRLSEHDLWAVTAFVQRLAGFTPAAYADAIEAASGQVCRTASQACSEQSCPPQLSADRIPPSSTDRTAHAALVLRQYACIACHLIPGVTGPETHVGPPLDGLWRRERIAGRLPADVDSLARWIRDPKAIDPGTAMPDMGVTDTHARLMAEYLLRAR